MCEECISGMVINDEGESVSCATCNGSTDDSYHVWLGTMECTWWTTPTAA